MKVADPYRGSGLKGMLLRGRRKAVRTAGSHLTRAADALPMPPHGGLGLALEEWKLLARNRAIENRHPGISLDLNE